MNNKLSKTTVALGLAVLATFAVAQERPADIVSPITDKALSTKVSASDARKAGRVAYEKPTPENSIMLFIDHQVGLMASTRDFAQASGYKANVVSLAQMAKALKIPVLLSSSNAQWQNGDLLPELKETFKDQPIYRRTGIINAYEDPTFRKALEELAGCKDGPQAHHHLRGNVGNVRGLAYSRHAQRWLRGSSRGGRIRGLEQVRSRGCNAAYDGRGRPTQHSVCARRRAAG